MTGPVCPRSRPMPRRCDTSQECHNRTLHRSKKPPYSITSPPINCIELRTVIPLPSQGYFANVFATSRAHCTTNCVRGHDVLIEEIRRNYKGHVVAANDLDIF